MDDRRHSSDDKGRKPRACAECGGDIYGPGRPAKRGPVPRFCSPRCGDVFNDRRKERGAQLYDLVMGRAYEPNDPLRPDITTLVATLKRKWRNDDWHSRGNRKSWADWRNWFDPKHHAR